MFSYMHVLQIRTILELESTITMLRCLLKISERTLYNRRSIYDWFCGSRKLERRMARINEVKNKDDFLKGEEVRHMVSHTLMHCTSLM